MEVLSGILFGWPAIIVAMILAAVGLWRRDFRFLVAAAILSGPFSWFLSGFPHIKSPVFLLPLTVFASAFAMFRQREMLAWFLALPFYLTILLLFYVILAG